MRTFYNIAGLFSGIIGGGLFLIFFFMVQMPLTQALLLGLAGFGGAFLFIYAFRPKSRIEFKLSEGITPELLESTLKEGGQKIGMLVECAKGISDPIVKAKIGRIIEVIKRIFDNFEKDPKDIKQ